MQNATQGSLYTLLFGLGTIPLMTSAIYFGKLLNTQIKQGIQKAIPIFVVLLGLIFILCGLGLGIPNVSSAPVLEIASSASNNH